MKRLTLMAIALVAVGSMASAKPSVKQPAAARQAARGLAFAQAHCSACHAVTEGETSPNPESPPFEAIANMPGLTRASLGQFLRDSHNYPSAMAFTVDRARIADLTAYMLSLQRSNYHPPI